MIESGDFFVLFCFFILAYNERNGIIAKATICSLGGHLGPHLILRFSYAAP